jgi:DNA transformation protein
MKPFRPNPKQTLKNYYEVPVNIMENIDQLTIWAKQAIFLQETRIPIVRRERY